MIQAYIDESGTHDQASIIVVAGLLSTHKRWRKFERQWGTILNPSEQDRRVFHATDCLGVEGYGDFKGWSKDDRNRLAEKLIPIVRQRTLFSFSAAFALKEYESIVPEWIRRKWKHPYYLCMFHIANLIKVNRSRLTFPENEKITFIIAHKPKFVGLLNELYEELKNTEAVGDTLGKMTLGTPEENTPLQAADLLCYLTRTFWEREYFHEGSAHPRTKYLIRELIRNENHNLEPHFLGHEVLQEFMRVYTETHKEAGEWKWNSS